MAIRFDYLQGGRDYQGHIHRCDRFYVDRFERRPILRHRGPDAQAARICRWPASYQVYSYRGHNHLVSGHRVRFARSHVLVCPQIPRQKRDALRGLLSIPGGTGACLPSAGNYCSVLSVLRGTPVSHRLLLRHDGQASNKQH